MTDAHRIIDANANRAREALRVMEDAARFVLNDHERAAGLKELRHELRDALADTDPLRLAAWRDTPADVGCEITTTAEHARSGVADVATAAAKRAGEALRALEEYLKITSPEAATRIESLRYRLYEHERSLAMRLAAPGAPQWSLCVLITEDACEHHTWEAVAEQAIEGGADCLQLREKSRPDRELLARARRLVEIAASVPTGQRPSVIINDRPDIALLAGADGVHVGEDDLTPRDVRRIAGAHLIVGTSVSTMERARDMVRNGVDYCGLGQMFASDTKQRATLAGPRLLADFLADPLTQGCPHLAIGGITPQNATVLAQAGARGVAVCAAVCKKKRPAEESRAFCEVFAPTHWGDRRRGG